jgi:hypothetical protein
MDSPFKLEWRSENDESPSSKLAGVPAAAVGARGCHRTDARYGGRSTAPPPSRVLENLPR